MDNIGFIPVPKVVSIQGNYAKLSLHNDVYIARVGEALIRAGYVAPFSKVLLTDFMVDQITDIQLIHDKYIHNIIPLLGFGEVINVGDRFLNE